MTSGAGAGFGHEFLLDEALLARLLSSPKVTVQRRPHNLVETTQIPRSACAFRVAMVIALSPSRCPPVQTVVRVRIDAGAMLGELGRGADPCAPRRRPLNSARATSVLTTRSFDYGPVLNTIPVVGPFRIKPSRRSASSARWC